MGVRPVTIVVMDDHDLGKRLTTMVTGILRDLRHIWKVKAVKLYDLGDSPWPKNYNYSPNILRTQMIAA